MPNPVYSPVFGGGFGGAKKKKSGGGFGGGGLLAAGKQFEGIPKASFIGGSKLVDGAYTFKCTYSSTTIVWLSKMKINDILSY